MGEEKEEGDEGEGEVQAEKGVETPSQSASSPRAMRCSLCFARRLQFSWSPAFSFTEPGQAARQTRTEPEKAVRKAKQKNKRPRREEEAVIGGLWRSSAVFRRSSAVFGGFWR